MRWFWVLWVARRWIGRLRILALLGLALACGPSWASSAPGYLWVLQATGDARYASAEEACVAQASVDAGIVGQYGISVSSAGPSLNAEGTGGPCVEERVQGTDRWTQNAGLVARVSGVCASGYDLQSDGSCKAHNSCSPAGSSPSWNVASGHSPTATILNPLICVGGCSYSYGNYWTGSKPGASGYDAQWQGPMSSTGKACDGSESNASSGSVNENSNVNCPDKTYQGTVNGQNVCVPYPTQTNSGTTTTNTTDTPASGVPANSNSSATTTTTCDGSTCTTTTTTTTTGGGGGSNGASSGVAGSACVSGASAVAGTCTTTTTQPQTDYCKSNPNASVCASSASGGADCSAPPTCSGDAISCAILSQQWQTRCDLQKDADSSITLGKQLQAGNDPMAAQLPTPQKADQSPVAIGDKLSSVDNMGIAEQCLQPISFSVYGHTYTFDTGPMCKLGQVLGALNIMSTLMLCAYMLKGSF